MEIFCTPPLCSLSSGLSCSRWLRRSSQSSRHPHSPRPSECCPSLVARTPLGCPCQPPNWTPQCGPAISTARLVLLQKPNLLESRLTHILRTSISLLR